MKEGAKTVEVAKDEDGLKGKIVIRVYKDKPAEVDFYGELVGSDLSVAWRAMMKGYRVWKHTLMKAKEGGKR